MRKFIWLLLFFPVAIVAAEETAELQEETELKFAIYSSAWGENTDDGLRIVAFNQTQGEIRLNSIVFPKSTEDTEPVSLQLALDIPSFGYADIELPYIDLLLGNECIERTMAGNWKLVEVSNYTLNPSVRNLIIEDTDSFRIYQCVENVQTNWTDLSSNNQTQYEEWVLFHFETRRED